MLMQALTIKGLAVAGVLTLGTVSAAAATGSLPDAAQDGLANAASHVGMTLPASHDSHPTKDDRPGGKPDSTPTAHTPSSPTHPENHGADVSSIARTTDATGRDKGEAVSTVARGDHGGHSTGTDHAAPQAGDGSAHAGDHPHKH
jgi:hypothetical protein